MPDWTYTPSGGSTRADIDVDSNGNSYFNSVDGGVESIDSTGTQRWSVDPNSDTTGVDSLSLNDTETRLFVSYGDEVVILDVADGSTISQTTGISPAVYDVYGIGSDTNAIVRRASSTDSVEEVDFTSGATVQSYAPSSAVDNIEVSGSYVYAATIDGNVHKLNRTDLSLVREESVIADANPVSVHDANTETMWFSYSGDIYEVDTSVSPWVTNWQVAADSSDIQYDSVDDELYTTGGGNDNTINRLSGSDGSRYRIYTSGTYSGFGQVAVPSGSKVIVEAGFGDIVRYDDSEFTTPTTSVTATQVNSAGTMNAADALTLSQVSATQVSSVASTTSPTLFYYPTATATMNTATVSSVSSSATQFESVASMNTTVMPAQVTASMNSTSLTNKISSTQMAGAAVMNETNANDLDVAVTLTRSDGTRYFFNGILYEGQHPTFSEAEKTTLTVFTDDEDVYNNFMSFARYISEDTIQSGRTFYNKPWYRETVNPDASTSSYLLKFKNAGRTPSLDDWWVVVTNITDGTRMYGMGYQMEVELLALTPVNGETFDEIMTEYEE